MLAVEERGHAGLVVGEVGQRQLGVADLHLREELLEKAEALFTAIGAEAELRRVRRLAEPSRTERVAAP